MAAIRTRSFGETIDRLERDLGRSAEELASALGASVSSLQQWRRDESTPGAESLRRLDDPMTLHAHLHETFKPEGIARASGIIDHGIVV